MDTSVSGQRVVARPRNGMVIARIIRQEESSLPTVRQRESVSCPVLEVIATGSNVDEISAGQHVIAEKCYYDGLDSDCEFIVLPASKIIAVIALDKQ